MRQSKFEHRCLPMDSERHTPAMVVMAEQMSERPQLTAAIVDYARLQGYLVYGVLDTRTPAKRYSKGFPDLLLLRVGDNLWDSRLVFAELKTQKGELTRDQFHWLTLLGRLADLFECVTTVKVIEVVIWRPLDWLDGTVEAALGCAEE